jgi:hypothetical protein
MNTPGHGILTQDIILGFFNFNKKGPLRAELKRDYASLGIGFLER